MINTSSSRMPAWTQCLCFQALAHSFALRKILSPAFSIGSALFRQNTRGGVASASAPARSSCAHRSPLVSALCPPKPFKMIFFADPHPLTPIESYSYKKQGGGGYSGDFCGPRVTHYPHCTTHSSLACISFLFTSFADPSFYLLCFHIFSKNTGGMVSVLHQTRLTGPTPSRSPRQLSLILLNLVLFLRYTLLRALMNIRISSVGATCTLFAPDTFSSRTQGLLHG